MMKPKEHKLDCALGRQAFAQWKPLAVAAMLIAAVCAHAQNYTSVQFGTNLAYAANTTNAINAGTVDCRQDNDIGIRFESKAAGTDTTALSLTIMKSLDGSYWDAAPLTTVTLPQIASTNAYLMTNLTLNAIGYVRLGTLINGSTNVISGVSVKAYKKMKRLGN